MERLSNGRASGAQAHVSGLPAIGLAQGEAADASRETPAAHGRGTDRQKTRYATSAGASSSSLSSSSTLSSEMCAPAISSDVQYSPT